MTMLLNTITSSNCLLPELVQLKMVRYKTPVYAPPPKYMQHQTDIRAPSVRTDWVNGRAKYTFVPPEIGPIRILDSDDEDEEKPVIIRAKTPQMRRPHSHVRGQSQGRHPHIKRESSAKSLERHRSHGVSSSPVDSVCQRPPRNRMQSYGRMNGGHPEEVSDNSSSSSDFCSSASHSGPVSSSSSPGYEFDGSSSSSSDNSDSDIYTPSTSPSRISSTLPRTRQQGAREASTRTEPGLAPRQATVVDEREGSEHAPLDFYINLPMRPGQSQSKKSKSSKPQGLSQGVASSEVSSHDTHDW